MTATNLLLLLFLRRGRDPEEFQKRQSVRRHRRWHAAGLIFFDRCVSFVLRILLFRTPRTSTTGHGSSHAVGHSTDFVNYD